MIFITIWAILFGVAGWAFAFAFMKSCSDWSDLTKSVLDGWGDSNIALGKLTNEHETLLNKIQTWGNDTSESESV